MDDGRLKRLLDKASAQIKRSTTTTTQKSFLTTRAQNDGLEMKEIENKTERNETNEIIIITNDNSHGDEEGNKTSETKNDDDNDDDIQAYLNRLSRKTRQQRSSPEINNNNNNNSQSEISLDSSLVEKLKGKNKRINTVVVVDARVENENDATTGKKILNQTDDQLLQRVSRYEEKYRKVHSPKKSIVLESSDSELNFSKSSSDNEQEISIAADVEIASHSEKKSAKSAKSSSSFQLEELHLVDELLESESVEEKNSLEPTPLTDREKQDESSLSEVQTLSYKEKIEEVPTASSSHEDLLSQVIDPTEDNEDISEEMPSASSDKELFRNIRFDTLYDAGDSNKIEEEAIEEPSELTETSSSSSPSSSTSSVILKTNRIFAASSKEKPSPNIEKHSPRVSKRGKNDIGIQVSLLADVAQQVLLPPQAVLDLQIQSLTSSITDLLVKQGTLEALTFCNPSSVLFNELIREQISFSKSLLASLQIRYLSQASSIQADYQYTTWEDALQDIRTRQRKKRDKLLRSAKKQSMQKTAPKTLEDSSSSNDRCYKERKKKVH